MQSYILKGAKIYCQDDFQYKDIVVENLSEQLLVELKRIRLLLVVIVFVLIVGSIL